LQKVCKQFDVVASPLSCKRSSGE